MNVIVGECRYCRRTVFRYETMFCGSDGIISHLACWKHHQSKHPPTPPAGAESTNMPRKGKGRKRLHKGVQPQPKKNMMPLPTEEEKDLLKKVKALNVEVPHEFSAWTLYFFSHSNYMRSLQGYVDEKIAGNTVKIDTDMTPHKASRRYEMDDDWGDPWSGGWHGSGYSGYAGFKTKSSPPKIDPPSGLSGVEHVLF